MPAIPGTNVASPIVPFTTEDVYPTHVDIYGKGGARSVFNNDERDLIPAERRSEGMLVYVRDSQLSYVLRGGISNADWALWPVPGISEAPIDGSTYGRKDASWIVVNDGSGGSVTARWNWQVAPQTGNPGGDRVGVDTAAPIDATLVYITATARDGLNYGAFLRAMHAGDALFIWDVNNSSRWIRYNVTADSIDNGTWFQIPVQAQAQQGVEPDNASQVGVTFAFGAGTPTLATETSAGIIELATQVETDLGADDARAITALKLANTIVNRGKQLVVRANFVDAVAKGDPVYVSGISGDFIQVSKATSSSIATMPGIGSAAADQAAGTDGLVVRQGVIEGINTTSYGLGSSLYIGPSGGLTLTRPGAPLAQRVGLVLRSGTGDGVIGINFAEVEEMNRTLDVATNAEVTAGTETNKYVTPATLAARLAAIPPETQPDASETVKGILELATQAETDAGIDDLRAVTPLKMATRLAALGAGLTFATVETGSWTPTFTFATPGNLSVSYVSPVGTYIRVGRLVFVSGFIQFTPTHTTASGNARIGGLPFAAQVSTNVSELAVRQGSTLSWLASRTQLIAPVINGQSYCELRVQGSAADAQALTTTQFPTATVQSFSLSGCYIADSAVGASFPVREKLVADRTYYVRTDGNDANTGLVNSAGGAFLTPQKAVDVVCTSLDMGGHQVTIQCGNGTYVLNGTSGVELKNFVGTMMPILRGDPTTPANVVFNRTVTGHVVLANNAMPWRLRGLTLQNSGSGAADGLHMISSSVVMDNCRFNACTRYAMQINIGSRLVIEQALTLAGSCLAWLNVNNSSHVTMSAAPTITVSGGPTWSNVGVNVGIGGSAYLVAAYSGAATGPRYSAIVNGVIQTNGGGASYLPGNAAGSTATGGQYT